MAERAIVMKMVIITKNNDDTIKRHSKYFFIFNFAL